MQTFQADLAVIGAGGAGLRAAIAAAQANPNAKIALISKVYPMRSHTVAAEGGSAAVAQDHDSFPRERIFAPTHIKAFPAKAFPRGPVASAHR